jgi:multidrug efflux pump subunit AcrA (membrane-fusion protein)
MLAAETSPPLPPQLPPQIGRKPPTKKRWKAPLFYTLIGALLLTLLALVLYQRFGSLPGTPSITEPVIRGLFVNSVSVNGILQPREQEAVSTLFTGPISAIWVAEGDIVSEGQDLFEVEQTTQYSTTYEKVTAPIAGSIVQFNLVTGKSFAEQSSVSSPGLVIAELTFMEVLLDVNEVDISDIVLGQTAELSFDAIKDLTLSATVAHIATLPNTGAAAAGLAPGGTIVTYPVKLALDEDDPRIKPGMSVSARITVEEMPDVLLVNALAIQELDGAQVVYVEEPNGDVVAVEVDIIASSPTQVVVEGQLREGERVLINAAESSEGGAYGELFTVRSRFNG